MTKNQNNESGNLKHYYFVSIDQQTHLVLFPIKFS